MTGSDLGRYLASLTASAIGEKSPRILQRIGELARKYPDAPAVDASGREDLTLALGVVLQCRTAHGSSDQLLVVHALLLGKLGRFTEAVTETQVAHERSRTWGTATAYANALRRSGDLDGCLKLMWEASELDVADVTALLDIGDAKLEQEQWAEALDAYEKALSREPGQPWAEPSALYCRFRAQGDAAALTALREVASRPPDECGVDAALAYIQGTYARDTARERAALLLSRI